MKETREDTAKQMSLMQTEIQSFKIEIGKIRTENEVLRKATAEADMMKVEYE